MSACEKCWAEAGGDPDRYAKILKDRDCSPEEVAGPAAKECRRCHHMTLHQHTGECTNCGSPTPNQED